MKTQTEPQLRIGELNQLNVADWFTAAAKMRPERAAIIGPVSLLTFADLLDRVHRIANGFLGLGIRPRDRVAVLMRNSAEFLSVYLALGRIGASAVLLNVRWVPGEIAYALKQTGSATIVFDDEFAATVAAATSRERLTLRRIPNGPESAADPGSLASLIASNRAEAPDVPSVDPDAELMILHTSGTTGFPKGAALTHRNVSWTVFGELRDNCDLYGTAARYGDADAKRTYLSLPLFHVAAMELQALPYLLTGNTVICPAGKISDTIEHFELALLAGATSMYLLRFQWRQVADAVLQGSRLRSALAFNPPRLQQMIVGGGKVDPEIFELARHLEAELTFNMGMTEAGPQLFRLTGDELREHNGALGRPRWFVQARVIDEDGETVPEGAPGELALAGPTVFGGYIGDAQSEGVFSNGWFRTGDLVRRDADGYYHYVGRKKDMIRTGGENVYAAEVERALGEIEAVREAAVIGVPDDRWGEAVKAVVVLRPGASATEAEIIEACRARLASYKLPRSVEFVADLPRSATGKLDKRLLRERWAGAS